MGKPTGFLEYKRETARVLPPKVRIANFNEFRTPLSKEKQKTQGARCMACGPLWRICWASAVRSMCRCLKCCWATTWWCARASAFRSMAGC